MSRQAETAHPRLLRRLTLAHAVLYGLGVTIGAGIYVLIGAMAGRSGMYAPIAFVVAALLLAFTAASFAELGTRMPVAASEAAYMREAFGREWLTLGVGLLVVGTAMVSGATIAVGASGYVGVFVDLPRPWLILAIVLTMGLVASLATVQSVTMAGLMTLVEVGGLVLIVAAGFWFEGAAIVARLPESAPGIGDLTAWTAIAGSVLVAVFAFIGFEHIVNVSEEIKAPSRTLPRALFLTLGLTAILYALVAWIAVVAVPPAELAASGAPLALVFSKLTGLPLVVMSAIAVVATLNGVIVHMILIGRVLYGMGDQGSLPASLAQVNPVTHTPIAATAIGMAVILVLALTLPLEGLAALTARLTLFLFGLVNLALIVVKAKELEQPAGIFVCPRSVPWVGLATSVVLFAIDIIAVVLGD